MAEVGDEGWVVSYERLVTIHPEFCRGPDFEGELFDGTEELIFGGVTEEDDELEVFISLEAAVIKRSVDSSNERPVDVEASGANGIGCPVTTTETRGVGNRVDVGATRAHAVENGFGGRYFEFHRIV